MLLQVWLPLIASLVVILALSALAIYGAAVGSSQVDRWGAIAAVLVILPVLLGGLIVLAIYGGSAYGVTKLLQKVPGWMASVQNLMDQVYRFVRQIADSAAKPVFAVSGTTTRASTLWDRIFHRGTTH